ncbi:50S ribosome-binding GTPase [Cereibacter sp. SYSU M97828]|nr:50S ribosome-binding GTPase [Cereibacter flavus]
MIKLLRSRMLRWDGVLALLAYGAPWVLCIVFGFLWLAEHGMTVQFILATTVLAVAAGLLRRWTRRRAGQGLAEAAKAHEVAADPEWLDGHAAIFHAARDRITARVQRPLPWADMPTEALATIRDVAQRFGRGGEMDFTIPEALLLMERAMSRYRGHVRTMMPFADSLKVSTLHWAWQHRETAVKLGGWGKQGYRLYRYLSNAPAAIAAEIQGVAASGSEGWLSTQAQAIAQIVLLEEVAFAATELYSGQLKFSDTELLEIGLASTTADRARLAEPDAPLRIVVVGQVSAGKSSVVNAVLGRPRAETDVAPTTDKLVTYEVELCGVDCHLIDMPGLNGSATRAAALAEMLEADLILWAVRANRPGRSEDVQLMAALDAAFAAAPDRRRPAVLLALTSVDALVTWPVSGRFSRDQTKIVAQVCKAVGEDLGLPPIPLSLSKDWNVDTLRLELDAALGPALMVQRNRKRLAGDGGWLGAMRQSSGAAGKTVRESALRVFERVSTRTSSGSFK